MFFAMEDTKLYKAKKKTRFRRLKAFGTAFSLTLCLLGLGAGFLIADYNTRRVAFGDSSVRVGYKMSEDGRLLVTAMGREMLMEVPEEVREWSGRLWTLVPARYRAAVWLTEAERAAAPALLELLEPEEAAAEGAA